MPGTCPMHQIHRPTLRTAYFSLQYPGACSSVDICKYFVKKKTVTNLPGIVPQICFDSFAYCTIDGYNSVFCKSVKLSKNNSVIAY